MSSSQPVASPSRRKGGRSGRRAAPASAKRRGATGASDSSQHSSSQLPGTPLDIAALPSANQVTLHTEDDVVGRAAASGGRLTGALEEQLDAHDELVNESGPVIKAHSQDNAKTTKKKGKKTTKSTEESEHVKDVNDEEEEDEEAQGRISQRGRAKEETEEESIEDEAKDKKKSDQAEKEMKQRMSEEPSQDPLCSPANEDEGRDEVEDGLEELTQRPIERREGDIDTSKERSKPKAASQAVPTHSFIDLSQNSDEDYMPLTQRPISEITDPLLLVTKRRTGAGQRKIKGLSATKRRAEKLKTREDSAAELDTAARPPGEDDSQEGSGKGTSLTQTCINEQATRSANKNKELDTNVPLAGDNVKTKTAPTKILDQELPQPSDEHEKEHTIDNDKEADISKDTGQLTLSQKERRRKEKGKAKEGDSESHADEAPAEPSQHVDLDAIIPSLTPSPLVCPVCNKSIKHMDAQVREAHVNACIDNRQQQDNSDLDFVETYPCALCNKDLTKWNAQRRQQHMERCLDKLANTISQQLPQQDEEDEAEYGEITGDKYRCPICKTDRSKSALVARIDHLKKCAKKHSISLESFRNTKKWNEMVSKAGKAAAAAPAQTTGGSEKKAKRTAKEQKTKTTITRRAKRTRKATADASHNADSSTSEVRSKFFEGVDAVSHANFLATIAKLRYKQKGTKDAVESELSHPSRPRPISSTSAPTKPDPPAPTVAVAVAPATSSLLSAPAPGSAHTSGSEEDEDFAEIKHFKRPRAKPVKKAKEKKLSYNDLVVGMSEEDENLMLAVALSDSLAPAPVEAPIINSSPESIQGPLDLAGFRPQGPKLAERRGADELVKELFPDASQDIQPTPKLAESALAKKKSPQPARRTSLWNLSSSGAGAYDPEFLRTNVLPLSDKKQLAEKAKHHPQVTLDMLNSTKAEQPKAPSVAAAADTSKQSESSVDNKNHIVSEEEFKSNAGGFSDASEELTQMPVDHPDELQDDPLEPRPKPLEQEREGENEKAAIMDDDGGFCLTQPLAVTEHMVAKVPYNGSTLSSKAAVELEPATSSLKKNSKNTRREDKLNHRRKHEEADDSLDECHPLAKKANAKRSSPRKSRSHKISTELEDGALHTETRDYSEDDGEEEMKAVGSAGDRKKRFVVEAEAVMKEYKAACLEAQQLMEERIKEIKAAYFAEIGRITIKKEKQLQKLQRKYQVTSSLLLSSPFSSDTSITATDSLPPSPSMSPSKPPLKPPKKRKSPNRASGRPKRTRVAQEERAEDIVEIGSSQLVCTDRTGDSDDDFQPLKTKDVLKKAAAELARRQEISDRGNRKRTTKHGEQQVNQKKAARNDKSAVIETKESQPQKGKENQENEEEDEEELTPSPIEHPKRRREDNDDDEEDRPGGGGAPDQGHHTEIEVGSRSNKKEKSSSAHRETSSSSKERKKPTDETDQRVEGSERGNTISDTSTELRNATLYSGLDELEDPLLELVDPLLPSMGMGSIQLSGKPAQREQPTNDAGGLESYGHHLDDEAPRITTNRESVIRIEILSQEDDEESAALLSQEKRYPGDPLSFIITKRPNHDRDTSIRDSDHESEDCMLASPPEDLGPASPSSSTAYTMNSIFPTRRITTVATLRPPQSQAPEEEDRLSPWSARILANKKKKQQGSSRVGSSLVTEHQCDKGTQDEEDEDGDLFQSPTPPPPPLSPLPCTPQPCPLASSQSDTFHASPLLFTPAHFTEPGFNKNASSTSTAISTEQGRRVREDDSDDSEDSSQEAEAERRRWKEAQNSKPRSKIQTRSASEHSEPNMRTKLKEQPEEKKRMCTSEEDPLAPLLDIELSPRDLLHSPIRSLAVPLSSQPAKRADRSGGDQVQANPKATVHQERLGKKRRRNEDREEEDSDKENVVNSTRERGSSKTSSKHNKNVTIEENGDENSDGEQNEACTPTCTPRTTLSLHSKRCHHTPKPVYSDMSDSLLKTLLSGFGVRAGSRKWMIEKLSEIWEASHEPTKALPLDHPSIVRGVKLFSHEKEDDPKKKEKEKELSSKITAWVKSNKSVYLKVLQYKEIDLLELQTSLKEEGIKCGREFLASYLNAQGVVFRGPPKKKRGWHM